MLKLEKILKELKKTKKNINILEMQKIKILSLDLIRNNSEEISDLPMHKEKIELMIKSRNISRLEKHKNKNIR